MNKTLISYQQTVEPIKSLAVYPASSLTEPIGKDKWAVREIIAHMYYWDHFILQKMVPHMADGADLVPFPAHDSHNSEGLKSLENESVHSIIILFSNRREELVQRLTKLEPDVRFTIGGGKRQFSPESFVKIFVKHDQHHLKQINEKLNNS
ncbi:DinB family protein [Alkalihalophilus marmarensis]|uniref:DinB family protein n=1 Tax=Alkalihalophilus marmarensis TaxID=521377 RepID=UPI002DBAE359|nr:DinB family protein [Alkalihalophilus marmarensis]MEC2070991.1 DinB family protein [Alkalihalophilus marmarensis]